MTTKKWFWKCLASIVAGLAVAIVVSLIVVRAFFLSSFVIPQNGMYPGVPAGSHVLARKRPYEEVSQVARGDIVIFEQIKDRQRYVFIWRVVGLPGETITVVGDRLLVNGKEAVREKIRSEDGLEIYRETIKEAVYEVAFGPERPLDIPQELSVIVPADHLFVMGDNRHHAADSRITGPIPFSSVIARKW